MIPLREIVMELFYGMVGVMQVLVGRLEFAFSSSENIDETRHSVCDSVGFHFVQADLQ